jgi:hypothetical protein
MLGELGELVYARYSGHTQLLAALHQHPAQSAVASPRIDSCFADVLLPIQPPPICLLTVDAAPDEHPRLCPRHSAHL